MSDFNGNNIPSDPTIPPIEKPEFEVPPQPAQFGQPEFQQMNYQQPYNMAAGNGMPPKKSKKKLIGIISAVVGVAACACVAIFAGPKIIDALSKSAKGEPIDRLKAAITTASEDLSDSVLKSSTDATAQQSKNFNMDLNLNVKLGDYIIQMIPEEYQGLKNLTLNSKVTGFNDQYYIDLDLATPIASAVNLNGFLDVNAGNVTLQIPALSSAYISDVFDTSTLETQSGVPTVSPQDAVALINDETKSFLDSVKEAKIEENVSVTASDVTSKYDKISVSLSGSEFSDVLYKFYERLTQEAFMKEFFNLYAPKSGMTIQDSLDELKSWSTSNQKGVTLEFYLDDSDKLKGFVIVPDSNGGNNEIGLITATDGKTGFDFYASEDGAKLFSMNGTYTKSGDAYSGKAKISSFTNGNEDQSIEISFDDITTERDNVKGSYTISGSLLQGFSAKFDVNGTTKSGNVVISVAMAGMDMATVSMDYTVEEATSCPTLPADAIVYDYETQQEDYLATADVMGFLTNFQNATGIDLTSLMQNQMIY